MDAEALIDALTATDGDLPEVLAEDLANHALSQPLSAYLTADDLLQVVRSAGTEARLRAWVERHGLPGAERIREQLQKSNHSVRALVPDGAQTRLLDRVTTANPADVRWAARYVDSALVRELLAPVFQDFLMRFVAGVPAALGLSSAGRSGAETATGVAAGLLGRLGKEVGQGRGRRILDVGKSVVGGLGLDLEDRMQTLAKEFSRGATDAFREALEDRLQAADGRALIRDLWARGLDELLATPLSEFAQDPERIPVPYLLSELPAFVGHNLDHSPGGELIEAEVRAYYALEGERPLREWLDDLGVLGVLEPRMRAGIAEQARSFFATDAFNGWLKRCLARARDGR